VSARCPLPPETDQITAPHKLTQRATRRHRAFGLCYDAKAAKVALFRDEMRAIAADPEKTRDYLLRISMIASLKRAAELG